MPNPSQEPPVSSKAPSEDLKDMYVLWTFKIKIERPNSEHWCINENNHVQIKIKMQNQSQELPLSSKALNQDLKNIDVL